MTATWRALAACLGSDGNVFHPAKGSKALEARSVCGACPVQSECLIAGLYEPLGIWGGLSRRERRTMARLLGAVRSTGGQVKADGPHGTNGCYRRGCRCRDCRLVHADHCRVYNQAIRARKKATA